MISSTRLLLFLWLIAAPNGSVGQADPNAIRPDKRYTLYCNTEDSVRDSADNLGYTEESWNDYGVKATIELLDYTTIETESPDMISDVNNLLSGTEDQYQSSWDCWINFYENYAWADLEAEGLEVYWETLGWTEEFWDDGTGVPDSEDKFFTQLNSEEQAAAEALCFEELTWNEEALEGTCNSDCACFSGSNQVYVRGKGAMDVSKLEIGDDVMGGNGEYSRVYSFSHYDHDMEAEYLQLHATGLSKPLEISSRHMLLVNNEMVPASQVKKGDELKDEQGSTLIIQKINTVMRRGAYAPVTESGDIVVGGVISSSYVALLDHAPVDLQFATHAFFAPLRLLCSMHFETCQSETYTNGYSDWIYRMMRFLEKLNTYGPAVQSVALIVAMPVLIAVYMLAELLMSPLALAAVATAGAIIYGQRYKTGKKAAA